MTMVDPQFQQHYRTWMAFTRLMKLTVAVVVVVLAGMAIFLT
jgi:hypothetical protein